MINIGSEDPFRFDELPFPKFMAGVNEATQAYNVHFSLHFLTGFAAVSLSTSAVADVRLPDGKLSPLGQFIIVLADSSEGKSLSHRLFFGGIKDLQGDLNKEYEVELWNWRRDYKVWKTESTALHKSYAKAVSTGGPEAEEAKRALEECLEKEPKEPFCLQLMYEDSSGPSFFSSISKKSTVAGLISQEGGNILNSAIIRNPSKLNNGWSAEDILAGRLESKSNYHIVDPRLTLFIAAQREVFFEFLDKHGRNIRESGFIGRTIVSDTPLLTDAKDIGMTPPILGHVKIFNNRVVEILSEYANAFKSSKVSRKEVKFNQMASIRYHEYRRKIDHEKQSGGRLENAKDLAGKFMDIVGRFAASMHVFEGFEGDITEETLKAAFEVIYEQSYDFLQIFRPAEERHADKIAEYIRDTLSSKRSEVEKRHFLQFGPRPRDAKSVNAALEILYARGVCSEFERGGTTYVNLGRRHYSSKLYRR